MHKIKRTFEYNLPNTESNTSTTISHPSEDPELRFSNTIYIFSAFVSEASNCFAAPATFTAILLYSASRILNKSRHRHFLE